MVDILARVLARRPYTPDLLGFSVNDFYMLLMIRRGNIDWNMLGSNVSEMTPTDRDALFVDFVSRKCQRQSGTAMGLD